jgi:hypothetical protein
MKRWLSRLLSVVLFTAVATTATYAIASSKVLHLSAAASPVYAATNNAELRYTDDSYEIAKESLAKLGISLSMNPTAKLGYATWNVTTDTDKNLLKASEMLREEWAKYTPQTIKALGLKKIYLVKDLSVDGQNRSGMPEPVLEDALYFDISDNYLNSEDGAYMRRTFHHEFKHLIDYNLYGSYSGDKQWNTCNVTNTTYGNGGGSMYDNPEYAHAEHPSTGFIDGYATSGIEEDRAEVYTAFMTNPEKLQQMTSKNAALSCKVTLTLQSMNQL